MTTSSVDPAVLRTLGRLEERALDGSRDPDARLTLPKNDGITIFIPNWNQRPFLPRAVAGALRALDLLRKAGSGGELIVVDDASRDGSQKLLRSLEMGRGDTRISTLFLRQNVGLARVRNIGLAVAQYRYVLFLDADNEVLAENLPLFHEAIRDTKAALVYGNLLERRGGRVQGIRSSKPPALTLLDENYIDAFALLDAEQVLSAGGFSTLPQLYGWEDWELVLHLIAHELEIVFVPAVMGYYTVNPGSMLRETEERADERKAVLRRIHAPRGERSWDSRRVGRIYDPRIGFLDECGDER